MTNFITHKKWAGREEKRMPLTEREMFKHNIGMLIAITINGERFNSRNYSGVFDALVNLSGPDGADLLEMREYNGIQMKYATKDAMQKLIDMVIEKHPGAIDVQYVGVPLATDKDFIESRILNDAGTPFKCITITENRICTSYRKSSHKGLFNALTRIAGPEFAHIVQYKRNNVHTSLYVNQDEFIKMVETLQSTKPNIVRVARYDTKPRNDNNVREYQMFGHKYNLFQSISIDGKLYDHVTYEGIFQKIAELLPSYAHLINLKYTRGQYVSFINLDDVDTIVSALKALPDHNIIFEKHKGTRATQKPKPGAIPAGRLFFGKNFPFTNVVIRHKGKEYRYNSHNYTNFYDMLVKLAPKFADKFPMRTTRSYITRYATMDTVHTVIEYINTRHPGTILISPNPKYDTNNQLIPIASLPDKQSTPTQPKRTQKLAPLATKNDMNVYDMFAGPNHPYVSLTINNIRYTYQNYRGLFKRLYELADDTEKKLFVIKRKGKRKNTYIARDKIGPLLESINARHNGIIVIKTSLKEHPTTADYTEHTLFCGANHPFSCIEINGIRYSASNRHGVFRALTNVAGLKYSDFVRPKANQSNQREYMDINDINQMVQTANKKHPNTVLIIPNKKDMSTSEEFSERRIFYGKNHPYSRVTINDVDCTMVYKENNYRGLFEHLIKLSGAPKDLIWKLCSGPYNISHMNIHTMHRLIDEINARRPGTIQLTRSFGR